MARILLVDDDENLLELLRFSMEREGYQVDLARNGQEALEKVRAARPDLIILDIMMPEMDGYAVNARLVENEATRDIPVIVLTAKGSLKQVFEMASNVVLYMTKPFDPNYFRDKVKAVLEKK